MSGSLFLQALWIGLSIAAPVGPVGLLVIQRTWRHGLAVGLATGRGAGVADAACGAIGAYGISALVSALQGARVPLALACGPNRRVVEALFQHVWQGGADAACPERLAALRARLAPTLDPDGAEVKTALRTHTEAAIAAGVFGVPSFELEGRVLWGLDALPMLRDALLGDAWFAGPRWDAAGQPRPGVQRRAN